MTGEARFCPQCGTRRTGFFRFCAECGFDFDELLPILGRSPAEPLAPAPAPTRSDLARPAPIAPPATTPRPVTEPPAAPFVLRPAPTGAAPPPDDRPQPGATVPVPIPATESVTLEKAPPATTILGRRPDLTLTRVAIVVLAALLAINAISGLMGSSSVTSRTPLPTTALGTPLVVDSPSPRQSADPDQAFEPSGETDLALVSGVVDGDTIRVEIDGTEYRLRYIGIDTPEPDASDPKVKELADAATAVNAALVEGQEVYLERDVSDTDQFGRLLRDVWVVVGDGSYVLVNLELVRLGYAQVTTYPPDVRYVHQLIEAQEAAKADGAGMWAPAASGAPSPPSSPAAGAPKPTVQTVVDADPECHPSYTPCLPVVADLDCPEVREMGAAPVTVKGPDDYDLDGDHDLQGCE